MATFTLYEYGGINELSGEPVHPEFKRTLALAFGVAVALAPETDYYEIIPDVDARYRKSYDGAAATAADSKIYADVGGAGNVNKGAKTVYVYVIAA